MPPSSTQLVQFRVGRDATGLAVDLERRAGRRLSPDLVARRDLERYYETLRRSLPRFTRAEAYAILDVTNGTLFDPWSVPLLWASVADAERLGETWQIDQAALAERLRGLSYAEALAVVDAAERFWVRAPDAATADEALEACGLVATDDEITINDVVGDLSTLDWWKRRPASED